jgi:hypothetical protein
MMAVQDGRWAAELADGPPSLPMKQTSSFCWPVFFELFVKLGDHFVESGGLRLASAPA